MRWINFSAGRRRPDLVSAITSMPYLLLETTEQSEVVLTLSRWLKKLIGMSLLAMVPLLRADVQGDRDGLS